MRIELFLLIRFKEGSFFIYRSLECDRVMPSSTFPITIWLNLWMVLSLNKTRRAKVDLKKIPLNFRVSVELQKMEAVDKLLNVISSQP